MEKILKESRQVKVVKIFWHEYCVYIREKSHSISSQLILYVYFSLNVKIMRYTFTTASILSGSILQFRGQNRLLLLETLLTSVDFKVNAR